MPGSIAIRASALALSLCFAGLAASQSAPAQTRADREFLAKAAQGGATEVEAARLALVRATHADVKVYAQQMLNDHTQAGTELQQLARAKGVKLPDEPPLLQKAQLKILAGRQGADFDRDYIEDFGVKAHGDMARLFQKGAQESADPDVKAYAQKTLPAVQHHLQMAQSLHTQLSAKVQTGPAAMGGSGTPAAAGK